MFAKFTGMAGIVSERIFTKADLKSIGVEDPKADLVFNRGNLFMVEVSNERIIEMLRQDGDFTLSENDNPPKIAEVATGDATAEAGLTSTTRTGGTTRSASTSA